MDNKIKNILEALINFWNEYNQTINILAAILIPISIAIIPFYLKRIRTNKILKKLIQKDRNELKKYLLYLENVEDLKENHTDILKINSNMEYINTFLETKINETEIKRALTETLKKYESTLTKTLENQYNYLSRKKIDRLSNLITQTNHAIKILEYLDINTNFEYYLRKNVKEINKNTQNLKELKRVLLILTKN